jgi:hypothetical protein
MERQKLIEEFASRIASVVRVHPVRVAIDGVDAAYKTTLADELAGIITSLLPVVRASTDGFHTLVVSTSRENTIQFRMATSGRVSFVQAAEQTAQPNCGPRRRPGITIRRTREESDQT